MCDSKEQAARVRETAKQILANMTAYHNHKESMAHAGLAVQVAVFVWRLSGDSWGLFEDCWVPVTFIIIWCISYVYIRWQLRNRRWAAIQIRELERRLCTWAVEDGPKADELRKYTGRPRTPRFSWLDLIFPVFKYGIPLDDGGRDKPEALVVSAEKLGLKTESDWIRHERNLHTGEWLICSASIIMLVFVLLSWCLQEGYTVIM